MSDPTMFKLPNIKNKNKTSQGIFNKIFQPIQASELKAESPDEHNNKKTSRGFDQDYEEENSYEENLSNNSKYDDLFKNMEIYSASSRGPNSSYYHKLADTSTKSYVKIQRSPPVEPEDNSFVSKGIITFLIFLFVTLLIFFIFYFVDSYQNRQINETNIMVRKTLGLPINKNNNSYSNNSFSNNSYSSSMDSSSSSFS